MSWLIERLSRFIYIPRCWNDKANRCPQSYRNTYCCHFVTIALQLDRKMTVKSICEMTQRLLGNSRRLSRNHRIMHSIMWSLTRFSVSFANRIQREDANPHEFAYPINGVVWERTWWKNFIGRLANGIWRLVTATPEIAKSICGIVIEAAIGIQ